MTGPDASPADRRATSFGAAADAYARYRPAPAGAALDWVLGGRGGDLLDVGAGTGAMTAQLVARGARVTAVEPDARMRRLLARHVPGATVCDGTAERLPVPGASQDAVLVHSAWHWFDRRAAMTEAARVLRDGGVLGVLSTGLDREDRLALELWRQLEPDAAGAGIGQRARRLAARFRASPRASTPTFTTGVELPFTPQQGPHAVRTDWGLTRAELIGWAGTYSGVLRRPADERTRILEAVGAVFDAHTAGSPDSPLVVPLLTRGWRTERRPR